MQSSFISYAFFVLLDRRPPVLRGGSIGSLLSNCSFIFHGITNKPERTTFVFENDNERWFRKAKGGVAEAPTIGSPEVTPAEDTQAVADAASAVDLVVAFDKLLPTLLPERGAVWDGPTVFARPPRPPGNGQHQR